MITQKHNDGSQTELYQNGDLVMLTEKQYLVLGADAGEWGAVILQDKKDRDNGVTTCISQITIATAGISQPKDSFQQRISSVPVRKVKAIPEQMAEALKQAKRHEDCNGMTPCVFRVKVNGDYQYGFNFQPITSAVGDRFHYDHGAGIEKNQDAEIIWLKHLVQ
tara:strand:+ start:113 stop:604 length:492 start_codon:yes stop_codon:yes gene_type:complete